MRIRHRLLPEPALRVRMHERRLDRPRPDQRHLHDDVVQMIRLGVQDRIDLRAALDLKRADRLAALNQLVRLRVVRLGKRVHLGRAPVVLLDARRTRCAPSPARRVRGNRTSARRSCRDRPCRTARSCDPSSSARRADSSRAAAPRARTRPRASTADAPAPQIPRAPSSNAAAALVLADRLPRASADSRHGVDARRPARAPCTRFEISNACRGRDSRARAWRPARRSARGSIASPP